MRSRPTIVVVAAGRGSRFGGSGHKLTQPLGTAAGDTVIGLTVRHAVQSQLPVVVVTTQAVAEHAQWPLALRDLVVLSDEQAARGMGHTIAAGVTERSGSPGWLILPGDMPLVQPGSMLAVAEALEQHPIVFAQFNGRRGHPVGFSAELYSELVMLKGDEGARRLTARYPVHGEEVQDPGVLVDVDTEEDLAQARSLLGVTMAAP